MQASEMAYDHSCSQTTERSHLAHTGTPEPSNGRVHDINGDLLHMQMTCALSGLSPNPIKLSVVHSQHKSVDRQLMLLVGLNRLKNA